jgi:hypothetical protein
MDHAFENMPTVSPDLGNSLWKGVGQGIDNFINGLIEEAGNLVGAAVTKGPGLLMDLTAGATAVVSRGASAVVDFKADFSPSASMGAAESHSHDLAQGKQLTMSVEPSVADLGQLPSPAGLPSMARTQGYSRSV